MLFPFSIRPGGHAKRRRFRSDAHVLCEQRRRNSGKRSDPRIGTQTFTATDLILSEPDPKLFDLPEGFKIVDRRQTAPPQN
jgi:hypothetical protein